MTIRSIVSSKYRHTSKVLSSEVTKVFAGTLLRCKKDTDLRVIQVLKKENIKMIFKDFGGFIEFLAFPPSEPSRVSLVFSDESQVVVHRNLEIISSDRVFLERKLDYNQKWKEVAKYGLASECFNCEYEFPLSEELNLPFDQEEGFGFDASLSKDARTLFASPCTIKLAPDDNVIMDDVPNRKFRYPCPSSSVFADVRVFFVSQAKVNIDYEGQDIRTHKLEIYLKNMEENIDLFNQISVSIGNPDSNTT